MVTVLSDSLRQVRVYDELLEANGFEVVWVPADAQVPGTTPCVSHLAVNAPGWPSRRHLQQGVGH